MKNIIANIVRGKSLTYLAAAFAALATSSAWAAKNWTGSTDGDFSESGNWGGNGTGRRYFRDANLTGNKTDIIYLSKNVSESSNTGLCFYDVPSCGYWRFNGQNQYTFDNSGNSNNYDQDLICIGYGGTGSSARFYAITLKTRHLTIGGDTANGGHAILKYDMTGHLVLDDLNNDANGYLGPVNITTTQSCDFYKGDLYATNANITCQGNMSLYNFTADKTGGDWLVTSNIKMNPASGNTSTFYHRDGNLVVANDLYVQDRANGEFYMEGGHVTVSNIVRFGNYNLNLGNIGNLYLNGGVFEAKLFRFHNADNWQTYGYVVFNGGTYKAMADGSMVTTADCRKGAIAMLLVKVGARGGTIDTAGHDVIFPLQLLKDDGGSGGLVVKGGGSLALSHDNITYNGKTFIEAGTRLVVSNNTAAANILARGIELSGTPALNTDYTIFACNKELADGDLDNVTCATAEITKSLGADGKSIVVRCTAAKIFEPRYIGPANGSLSDGANWSPAGVPTSGSAYIPTETAANLTVGDMFSPSAITFLPGSAAVTISGNALANIDAITNLSLGVQTFANSVTFKDAYRVYCDGYAVNFAGGATATCPAGDMVDNVASHMLMGDITFTSDWAQGDIVNPYTVPNGSVLHGEDARGTATTGGHCFLSIEPGGKAYFKTAFVSHNKSLINTDGELHVEGVLQVGDDASTANCHATHDENDTGVIYAGGIHKQSLRNVYIKVPTLYIGSQGLGAKAQDYVIHFANAAKTVYATDDFEIFSPTNSNKLSDWGLQLDQQVTFNTQGHTINWTGAATGSGALVKDGEGTLIFDPPGTALSGAVTVNGGTLKVMSASGVSSGATTVKDGATLAVASGATLGTSSLTLEAGSTLIVPSVDLPITIASLTLPGSGTATIQIDGDAALAENDYEVFVVTGGLPAGFADKVNIVLPDGTSENRHLYTTDNGTMRLVVGSGDLPSTWTGAAGDGRMNTAGNWLGSAVPPAGATVFIPPTAGEIVNDIENFAPASITFGYGSDTVTISGNAITGVVAITNLSTTASHTINAPVAFADKIFVVQGAMSWEQKANPSINFAGGVTGTTFANGTARYLNGAFTLTTGAGWVANTQGGNTRWGLPAGSSLTLPSATDTSELALGDSSISGGAFTTGVLRTSARLLCWNYGEYVVTNEFTATFPASGVHYCGYENISNGKYKFEKMTLEGAYNSPFKFGNGRNAADTGTQRFLIGSGGLCFANSASQTLRYETGGANNNSTVRLDPWHGDYTIHTKSASNPTDFTVSANTYFGTTDEDGNACTVTDYGVINSHGDAAQIHIDGNGTFLVNAVCAATCPVTVTNTATLAFGASGSLGTGAITLGAGTTLSLTATSSSFTPLANVVTLPTGEDEKVTIRIDGARLKSGPQTILSNVAAGATTANVELDMASAALDGRTRATLAVNGSNLVLNIEPTGTIFIVR